MKNRAWYLFVYLIAVAAICQAQTYTITTVAGGTNPYFLSGAGDGAAATSAALGNPFYDVAGDSLGNLYIAAGGLIRKVSPQGTISTVAGGGTELGEGVDALRAALSPTAIKIDSAGNILVADTAYGSYRIRKVDTKGVITTIAGGACCDLGDGGPATSAYIEVPYGLALDGAGNLYIAQVGRTANLVRKVSVNGTISTVAGGGACCDLGDGGSATAISLTRPTGVAVDGAGNLFIADTGANRVRKVSGTTITTVAGTGAADTSGDGGDATQAGLDQPWHVAVDSSGNLYITQFYDARVRMVTPTGTIKTIAGDGTAGYSGDGGVGTNAELDLPAGIAAGGAGIYIADGNPAAPRVRLLSPTATVNSSPSGLDATLDTVTSCATPCVFTLTPASTHTIAVDSPQAAPSGVPAGTRYVFSSWSDGGAVSHSITMPSAPATYTAIFQPQYQLTTSVSPATGGSVTPATGEYYSTGSLVSLTAAPNNGYTFASWSDNVSDAGTASTTVTMGSPQTVVANFTFTAAKCDLSLDGILNVPDVVSIVSQVLGVTKAVSDVNGDGFVNVVDAQVETNSTLGLGCPAH